MNNSFRLTKQKQIVLNEVKSRYDHPTADEIYESIHAKYPGISKSTVYRNLSVLNKEGLIRLVKVSGVAHFDLTLKNHMHVVCKCCHKVVDVGVSYNADYDKTVEEKTGFIIDEHNFMFEGICPECQRKLKSMEEKL